MEYKSPLSQWSRSFTRFVLLVATITATSPLSLWGCGSSVQGPTPDLMDGNAFIRRVTGGVEVMTRLGVVEKTVECSEGGYLAAMTPDLSGYAFTSIDRRANDAPYVQTLRVKLGPLPSIVIARNPIDEKLQPLRGALKLLWLTADGNECLVLHERMVEYVRIIGQETYRLLIATDAGDIAATSNFIYVLTDGSDTRVRRFQRPVGKKLPVLERVFDTDADGLYSGSSEDEILLWSYLPRVQNGRTNWRTANLRTGEIQELLQLDGVVFRVMSSSDRSRVIVEWWDEPYERFDGTMKTVISLWDYSRGQYLNSFNNKQSWELHCTTPPCEAIALREVD